MNSVSPLEQLKAEVVRLVAEKAGVDIESSDLTLPNPAHGDLALPVFTFAELEKISPVALATRIASAIGTDDNISAVAVGPYVNFTFTRPAVAEKILKEATDTYEQHRARKEPVVLDDVSPNTNKPLHLGHLRNAALGWSLAKLLEAVGYEVVKAQIINDRGIHIMKPILAYQRWGENKTPESEHEKGDHFVAKYYVQYGEEAKRDPSLDEAAQALLQQWESGDAELKTLWQKLRQWTLDGHDVTEQRIGVSFDRTDFESEIYEDGKTIVRDAVKKGLAREREDGAIVIDVNSNVHQSHRGEMKSEAHSRNGVTRTDNVRGRVPESATKEFAHGDGSKVLLRADGTSVYITQDLALAKRRLKETRASRLLYVIGQEQDYQFEILFGVLDKLDIAKRDSLVHVSYHHVLLPEGRMKSREGTVVDTDNLLDELHALAREEVIKRTPELDTKELERRAEVIALAAAKYYLLRVRPNSDITFNPKESIAFVGNTGPYLLYTYARVQSIFRKLAADNFKPTKIKPVSMSDSEWSIIMLLARFPDAVEKAAGENDPSILTDFTYQLAKAINDFYEKESVVKADEPIKSWRFGLLQTSSRVLARALTLLGMQTLDEM